jgi:hypothetical protein
MCRMWPFLAILWSFFQSSLLYTSATLLHLLLFNPPSLHPAILVYLFIFSLFSGNNLSARDITKPSSYSFLNTCYKKLKL